jgi:hypothetical protein
VDCQAAILVPVLNKALLTLNLSFLKHRGIYLEENRLVDSYSDITSIEFIQKIPSQLFKTMWEDGALAKTAPVGCTGGLNL